MPVFTPPASLTVLFVVLTALVVLADVWLVRRAAPAGAASRWTTRALGAAALWLGVHAAIAASGALQGQGPPPAVVFYLPPVMLIGAAVAFSDVGTRLAALPLVLLVGLQAFRVPLEWLLHSLYEAGALPVQMTWSGANFDVLTGLAAAALAGVMAARGRDLPLWMLWIWNVLGLALLVTVVGIAVMSTPGPLRRYMEDPPVVLAFHVPYTWIVTVHVWTAFVGHLVVARALLARGRRARA